MINEVFSELEAGIQKAHESFKRDLGKLRTGRAHPGMMDSVRVDYYGVRTPLAQMATVSVPEPRMLTVKPWDKTTVQMVEKAIREANLGLNPQTDADLIRIPVPPLSEERRKELVKVAKKAGEDCKIAIRKLRHDALDIVNELKKEGEVSEDDAERAKKKVEDLIGAGGQEVDAQIQKKEKEILQV